MKCRSILGLLLLFATVSLVHAEDLVKRVREAVNRSTLDQPGTKPFHLRAEIAPSTERDKASGRTGTVEIWWSSPTRFKREVRSADFHQVEVVDGERHWQKSEGDYFPEWLRETAAALVRPVPPLDDVLRMVPDSDVKRMMGTTYITWMKLDANGKIKHGVMGNVALTDSTGLLFYCGELGWGALYKDYKDFHGRKVARIITQGSPEVTAKIVTLEELGAVPPEFFDAQAPGSDQQLLDTVVVDETVLHQNLQTMSIPDWPALDTARRKDSSGRRRR